VPACAKQSAAGREQTDSLRDGARLRSEHETSGLASLGAQRQAAPANSTIVRIAVASAFIAAAFCLVVALAMTVREIRSAAYDPLKSSQITALKQKLVAAPKDEQLKEQIRALDLELRRRYFQQLTLNRAGAWMLLTGTVVFLLAGKHAARLLAPLPMPQPRSETGSQAARATARARRSVCAGGAFVVLMFLVLSAVVTPTLPPQPGDPDKLLHALNPTSSVARDDGPSPAEMRENWPRFRGPDGNGVSSHTNAPLMWDLTSGTGVVWKTQVPLPGFSSPVVWSNRVFVSGSDVTNREVYCFDAETGQLMWRRSVENVPGTPPKLPEVPESTGFAAATMATDGRRAYAIFAHGDLVAFAYDGTVAWAKNIGVPKNPYGHASSLVPWQGRLIVQLDQGDAEQGISRLFAFEAATGKLVWQQPRRVTASWSTPLVIEAAGKTQIIALSVPWIIGYGAADGTELWRVEGMNGEVTPSPVYAAGLLFVASPSEKLMAIRPDGQGDVTKSHIAWTSDENVPDIASPVTNGELVFTVTTAGLLTCFDARDGKKQFEKDLSLECESSPSISGNRLYVFSANGPVVVAEVARQFNELARSDMGEKVFASPAFARGRIYVRGATHLFCLGTKTTASALHQ
jgi:outer membrane protein assembly factor BamB